MTPACTARAMYTLVASFLITGTLGGCNASPTSTVPLTVPTLPAQVDRIALSVDVPTTATPRVAAEATYGRAASPSTLASSRPSIPSWHATFGSLLGVDGVAVEVDRVDRSVLGQFTPGRVRVFVRMRLRNALDRTLLLCPTFPAPPAGEGIYLFTVQSVAVASPGGVTTGGSVVSVAAPSSGTVHPGPEWEGALYDYVRGNALTCATSAATCARWKRFDDPIAPGGASEWRTASYDIAPTVHHMRLRFVVAADLANR